LRRKKQKLTTIINHNKKNLLVQTDFKHFKSMNIDCNMTFLTTIMESLPKITISIYNLRDNERKAICEILQTESHVVRTLFFLKNVAKWGFF
jgi:hypothetical protein